jgi:hypothetical protein
MLTPVGDVGNQFFDYVIAGARAHIIHYEESS